MPRNTGHFVKNISDEPVEMLEIFRSDEFCNISLFQWIGETLQRQIVDTLFARDEENGLNFLERIKNANKDIITKPDFTQNTLPNMEEP